MVARRSIACKLWVGEEEDGTLDLSLFDDEEVEEAEEQMARAKVTTTEARRGESVTMVEVRIHWH